VRTFTFASREAGERRMSCVNSGNFQRALQSCVFKRKTDRKFAIRVANLILNKTIKLRSISRLAIDHSGEIRQLHLCIPSL